MMRQGVILAYDLFSLALQRFKNATAAALHRLRTATGQQND